MTDFPLPDLSTLAVELESGAPGLAVGGVVPGARSLALAALAAGGWPRGLALAVVPHVSEAGDLAAGLQLLAPGLRVGVAPAELAGPYLGTEPALAARMQMVELLQRISEGAVDLLVVPARLLGTPVPIPQAITDSAFRISAGRQVVLDALATKLSAAGFRRVDLVEEAGEFTMRGWVVDIHPGGEAGYRLHLDDDLVESIRCFDPADQRSFGEAFETVTVLPLDPFPADPERLLELASQLETEYPALAVQMAEGAERRLWWGALHLAGESTAWLDLADHVVVCDRDEVLGELGRWWQVQEREWQALSGRVMEMPPPDRLLFDPEKLKSRIEKASLRLEQLELVDGSTTWRRVATHPADSFMDGLPIGTGRLAAMVLGTHDPERVALNPNGCGAASTGTGSRRRARTCFLRCASCCLRASTRKVLSKPTRHSAGPAA